MALRSQIAETAPFIPPPAPKAPKTTPSCLLTIDQTPAWYERNPFILTGYLPESRSALLCLRGWTFLHNETGNIYTHLIPALISILAHWMLCAYLQENYPDVAWEDRAVLSLYLSGVTTCLGLSTMYHTFMNHSPTVNKRCLKFDYIGILVLIFSSFASGIYFAFYCEPMPRNIYLLMIVALAVLTLTFLLSPKFQGPKWRTPRLLAFLGTCFSALAPLAHGSVLFGAARFWELGAPFYLLEGVFMLSASYFYHTLIPERLYPGRFDIWGQSHSIFHLLVVLGIAMHFRGIMDAFDYNYHWRQGCMV